MGKLKLKIERLKIDRNGCNSCNSSDVWIQRRSCCVLYLDIMLTWRNFRYSSMITSTYCTFCVLFLEVGEGFGSLWPLDAQRGLCTLDSITVRSRPSVYHLYDVIIDVCFTWIWIECFRAAWKFVHAAPDLAKYRWRRCKAYPSGKFIFMNLIL